MAWPELVLCHLSVPPQALQSRATAASAGGGGQERSAKHAERARSGVSTPEQTHTPAPAACRPGHSRRQSRTVKAAAPGRHVAASAAPIAHFVATIPPIRSLGAGQGYTKTCRRGRSTSGITHGPGCPAQDLKSAKTVKQNRRGGA